MLIAIGSISLNTLVELLSKSVAVNFCELTVITILLLIVVSLFSGLSFGNLLSSFLLHDDARPVIDMKRRNVKTEYYIRLF